MRKGAFHPLAAASSLLEVAVSLTSAISMFALVLMMVITFVAVVLRYLFNMPLLGVNEVIELLSVVCVFLAMPLVTAKDAHVRVDIFDGALGKAGRLFGDIFSSTIAVSVYGVLVYKSYLKALDAAEFEDATNMLDIQIWPFYALIVVGISGAITFLLRRTLVSVFSQEART